ncbi:hypothetical protein CXB51_004529 [Gossypium anomalum]|uniref:WAT1-related protein n=1 Tax=Gossypium anomalum TaxID=47600 RepID=A0A8J5ZFN5_9ROSI|nr:hypothetical protein CXB51_004529 [Gossypium anomalum]
MGRIENIFHRIKPPLLMVLVQIIFAGIKVMYKLPANDGMSLRVIVVYRFMFASIIMVPLKSLKKINRKVLLQAFLCGLFGSVCFKLIVKVFNGGSLVQNFTLRNPWLILIFCVLFVLNLLRVLVDSVTLLKARGADRQQEHPHALRAMENLAIRTNARKAKVCGILIGIGGAMVFTFYKGIDINIWSTNVNLLKHHHHQQVGPRPPYHGTGHFTIVCTVKDWNQRKLGWNVRLLAVTFMKCAWARLPGLKAINIPQKQHKENPFIG